MLRDSFMNVFGNDGSSLLRLIRRIPTGELRNWRILTAVAIGIMEKEIHDMEAWLSDDDDSCSDVSSISGETESLSTISSISYSRGKKGTRGASAALIFLPTMCALIAAFHTNDKETMRKYVIVAMEQREAAKAKLSAIQEERRAAKKKTRRRLKRKRDDGDWINMTICYKKKVRVEPRNPCVREREDETCDPSLRSHRCKERKLKVSRK